MTLDLLIEGGTIYDGTGNPGYRASIGVQGERVVVLRGDVHEIEAARRIDATGKVVAPGFIDMHSHSGLVLLAAGDHEAKIRQGVTSELIGVDGNSYAPFRRAEDLFNFVRLNAGLDGRPDLAYDWDTVAAYLTRFDRRVAVNVAMVVGNSALRIDAVGWDDVRADATQLDRMRGLLREAMAEGAFGLSTGLDYPTGSYATTEELGELAREAAALGGIYHTHVRYQLGDRFLDPFREALTIGRLGGSPVHLTHLYRRATFPGGAARMLDLVDAANREGLDVTFDSYPYEWSSTRLLILIPLALQDGGPDRLKERLADPVHRPAIREAIDARARAYGGEQVWESIHLGAFTEPENLEYEGKTIAEVVALRGQHPADVLCDLLISEDLAVNEVATSGDAAAIPRFLAHSHGMVGTDSVFLGERPSPRTYGSFPRILGEFVREERHFTLPEAIRKMTSFPAQRLGLYERGLLRDGMIADIVVFDAERVRALATYRQPRVHSEGIEHVIVNGTLVLDAGQMTGARPGRALRRGRPDR